MGVLKVVKVRKKNKSKLKKNEFFTAFLPRDPCKLKLKSRYTERITLLKK